MNLSRDSNPKKLVSIERRLKSWKIEYKFKRNQPNLSRGWNLNRDLNSLNSVLDSLIYPSQVQIVSFIRPNLG